MISKIKKTVSILLSLIMVFSVFAIVPFTVNAAPPGGSGGGETGTEIGGSTAVITPAADGDYLTFTAEEAGSSVTLKVNSGSNLQYSLDGGELIPYTPGTQIMLENEGDFVRFRGKNTTFNRSNHVSITGKVACSGNVMSLRLDDYGEVQGLSDNCFSYMFYGCTGLTAAPELPETTLANYCYSNMFYGCTSLTTAPELPATTLAKNCYYNMFARCGSLTTAPELPATLLARYCYSNMFARCANLTTAPELPATALAENCYYNMFSGCESLTTAPELPATTLEYSCYSYMFNGCTRLTTAPELPATTLAPYCYTAMFAGCSSIKLSETQTDEYSIPYSVPSGRDGTTASSALYYMFDGTGGTFTGTPEINKIYYRPPVKYTVTWKNEDGTTIDTTSVYEGDAPTHADPTKAADGDLMYVFSGWTDGTNTYGASDTFPAVTGDVTYTATFTSAVISERAANLVEITDHETDLADLGIDEVMSEWGRSMIAQEAITLARYMSAQNDGAKCAVLYEVVDGYDLQYAMSDGTTGSYTSFYSYTLNDFLPDYKVYYLPVNSNPQTIELNLNQDNATVIWYDATDSDGYWSMEAAYNNDSCYLVLKGNSNQPAGTYEWADMRPGCEISDIDASQRIDFVDGSCTVTVDEDVVTVSGTFTGRDRNTYVVTVTYEAPYYTITAESVNGAVTAEVNGADVTKAKAGKTVLLNVAPADGYQLKSITAGAQKTTPENFSDLVALMGDAVFDGDEDYNCAGYTCKVENGKFVVYNGTTFVTELSESNMTGFNGDTDYVEANSDNIVWTFYVENGEITEIDVADANADYETIFSSVSGSKSTGTLQPVQVDLTTVAEGSQYSFTMPAKNVTVKAEFEEAAPAPAPAKLILNVGENGKVVMDNGTFGNATVASNITGISTPIDVVDGANALIIDGHSVNIVEGGSINIATGGEVSFYPSADNTGKITAIPDEGYICTGWYNGDTRYTTKDTIDYQAISEDMTLTAKFAPDLFPQHSITLGGNIGVNFYINSAAANFASASKATVKFTWDGGGEDRTKEVDLTKLTTDGDGYYKATVDVVAAQMAHKIHAEVYLDGKKLEQTDDYSVQDYAETVFKNPAEYDSAKPNELKALAQALLNYGAMAQTVFASSLKEHPALANKTVGNNGYAAVTAEQIGAAIKGSASDLDVAAAAFDAEFYTSSLIYLSRNTLRLYFTPASKTVGALDGKGFSGDLSDYYYYVDHADIPAAELDDQQTFTVGDTTFTFSALDYAKAVVESTKMEPEQQNLAKALYLYNKAANAYFDAVPAPVENVVDLGTLEGDYEAQNNDVLTGKLVNQYKITIADGATVTLKDADITCLSSNTQYDGIALLGDATILLEGENTVKGGYKYNAGIFVPENKTLTIDGTGSLNVSSGGAVSAIGAKRSSMVNGTPGGNIVINGGTINANGGNGGAGIGGCTFANCGTITINGGNITAVGNDNAPGIGSGNSSSFCASITINGGTVTATGNKYAAGIGSGWHSNCGDITIAGTVTQVTATKGEDAEASIGAGYSGTCGTVTIAPGANVIQN